MTVEDFNSRAWVSGLLATHKRRPGLVFPVVATDADEKLVGLGAFVDGGRAGETTWVRCENVEVHLLKQSPAPMTLRPREGGEA